MDPGEWRNWWIIVFVVLLVSFPGDRYRRRKGDAMLFAAVVASMAVIPLVWMLFLDVPGNLLLVWSKPALAERISQFDGVLGFAAAIGVAAVVFALWLAALDGPAGDRAGARGQLDVRDVGGVVLQGGFTTAQSPFLVWPTLIGLLFVPVVFLFGVLRSWLLGRRLPTCWSSSRAAMAAAARRPCARAR